MADQNSITSPTGSSSSNNGNGMATVQCIPQPHSQHTNQHQGCTCAQCYNLWRYQQQQQQQQQQHSYSIPPPPAYTSGSDGEVMYNYEGYGAPVPPPPGTQAYLRRSASWGSMDYQAQAVPFVPQEGRPFVFPVQMGQQQQVSMVNFGMYSQGTATTALAVPPQPNYHYTPAQQQQASPVQTRSPHLSRPVSIQDQRASRKAFSSPANFVHDTSAESTPPVSTNSESNNWSFFTSSSVVVPSPPAQDMDMVTSPPPRLNSSMSPATQRPIVPSVPSHQLISSAYPPAPSYVVQTGPSMLVDQRTVDAQAQLSMEIQALVSAQPPPPPQVNTSFSDFSKLTASLVKSGTPSPPPRSPLRSSQGSRSPSSPNSPQRSAEKKKLKKSSRRKTKKSKSRSQKGSKHRSSSSPKQQQKKRRKKQEGSDAEESEDDTAVSLELQRTNQNRLIWTKELHTLFLSALDKLGIDAMPKAVLAAMNVEGLTRENIASHLQKYRLKLQQEEKRNSVLQAAGDGQASSMATSTTTTTTTTSAGSSAPAEQVTEPMSEPTPKVSAPSLAMYRDGGFADGMDLSLSFPGLLGYCSSDEEEEEEWSTNANSSTWFNESQVLSASSSTDSTANIGDSAVIPSFSFMFLDCPEDYERDQRPQPPSFSSSSSSSSSMPRLSLPVSIQRSCSPCSISSSSDNSPTSTPKVGRPELVVRGSI